jgi:hypothetical protein|tara:strand:- start:888 stop:1094 length:207 start_codon:yes stop_codon:yes gene_type:complete
MKDINEIMPKIPNMKWGALLNKKPSSKKIDDLNNLFPHNGKWHTVFEEKDVAYIDGVRVFKKDKESWT